jgi:hypothetical protein
MLMTTRRGRRGRRGRGHNHRSPLREGARASERDNDLASRAMVDGLCAMANIVPVTGQVIGSAVFRCGHSYRV